MIVLTVIADEPAFIKRYIIQQQQIQMDYPTLLAAAQLKLQQRITTTAEVERVFGKTENS